MSTRSVSLALLVLLLSFACADDSDYPEDLIQDKTKTVQEIPSNPQDLSQLRYADLKSLSGEFTGYPLWVSNNPEDVTGYGVLSSTRPQEAKGSRSQERGAPLPDLIWGDAGVSASEAQGCSVGTFRGLNLYLAHILSSRHLSGSRRLSIVVEATEALTLRYGGLLGTTSWSDPSGMKTVRPDWLGAKVAHDALMRAMTLSLEAGRAQGQVSLTNGERFAIETLSVDSLVEGSFTLESAGCFAVHVIAHDQAYDPSLPLPSYASGDVKWPGWYNGVGFGRASGLYEGSLWEGRGDIEITQEKQAFGWKMFDADGSPAALGRHGDSAELLFGGYGVVYSSEINLTNSTQSCVSAHVGFTSYVNLKMKEGVDKLGDVRTPSVRDLNLSDPSARPSMLWNGPLLLSQQLGDGSMVDQLHEVIMTPTIARDEWGSPNNIPRGLHKKLFRWDLKPGENRLARLHIPVPGYIVAPAAITVETSPCP